jgi:ubiquinone biosynthesis protein COQ4
MKKDIVRPIVSSGGDESRDYAIHQQDGSNAGPGLTRWAKLRHHLASLYALYGLGRNTNDVRFVFMIGNAQDSLAEPARRARRMRDPFDQPELEAMWRARYCPQRYDVDALLALPGDSLGGAYARHMKARGLRPDFYDDVAPRHRLHFLRLRLRQTHDVWHVLTGYDTDPVGELGLQGFYFGQVTNGQSALIFAGGVIRCLLTGTYRLLEDYVQAFAEGFRAGRNADSLLAVRWEDLWMEPLEALRQRFNIATTAWRPECQAWVSSPTSRSVP